MLGEILDLPMKLVYWLSSRLRAFVVARQIRSEVVVTEGEPEGASGDASPRQEGGNPLRFRLDLWAIEGDDKMAMDLRSEKIILPKPWGLVFWAKGRAALGLSLLDVFTLRVWINKESKTLWYSTTWLWNTVGKSYGVDLVDIQVPEQIDFPGVWQEVLFNVSGITFSVKGSGATKTEKKAIPLTRRAMWWPENIHNPTGARVRAGAAYVQAFKSLAKWASSNQWT